MLGIGLETARDLTGDHDVPQPKPSGNHERSKHREHEDLAGPASHAAAESDAHGLCTTIVEQSSRLDPGLAGHGRAGTMPAAFGIIPVFILNGAGVTNRGNNQRSTAGRAGIGESWRNSPEDSPGPLPQPYWQVSNPRPACAFARP